MDISKNHFISRLLLSILLFIFVIINNAKASDWESLTSFRTVKKIISVNDTVYCATSGGILKVFDPDLPGEYLTNIDGLGTTDISDIIIDTNGIVWAAGYGRVIRLSQKPFKIFPTQTGLFNLRVLEDDDDLLWAGSDSGLVLFSKIGIDSGGFRDRFPITSVNSFPVVNDIFLENQNIWLATENGLTVADRTDPKNLKSPDSWSLFNDNSNPELGTNNVKKVLYFEDSLHLMTANKVFRMSIGLNDTSFTELNLAGASLLNDMQVEGDSLLIYYISGVVVIRNNLLTLLPTNLPTGRFTGSKTSNNRWIAAIDGNGLYFDTANGLYREYSFHRLPGNNVTDVGLGSIGLESGGFGNNLFWRFENNQWDVMPYSPPFSTSKIKIGQNNETWIGTIGAGLWRFRNDMLNNYNDTNSTIVGNNDNPPGSYLFAWVTDIEIQNSVLFASLFRAYTGYPISMTRIDTAGLPIVWDSIGFAEGITDRDIAAIDVHDTVLVIASQNDGVYYYVFGTDPFDKSDDILINYTTANSFIISDVANEVTFSPDGELWVGTNFGVSRLDRLLGQQGEVGRFVDVITPIGFGPNVTVIEFDQRGNAWVGSDNGLVKINLATGFIELFKTDNSDLLSDEISTIRVDDFSGDVFVTTPAGISRYISSVGGFTSSIDSVIVSPNPFIVRSDLDSLRFNFSEPYTFYVYSVAGELVWQVTELSNQAWGGRNQHGKRVASGVYFIVLQNEEGKSFQGKVFLVKE